MRTRPASCNLRKTSFNLLSSCSESGYKLIRGLALPRQVGALSYDEVVALLDGHFKLKKCTYAERYKFHSATQHVGQGLPEWAAQVRGLAIHCGFLALILDEQLRDHFMPDMAPGPEKAVIINKETQSSMEVLVEGQRAMQVEKLFRERNITFVVIVSDFSSFAGTSRRARPASSGRIRSPLKRDLDWKDFYPLHVVYHFLSQLETAFPSTCTVSIIGRSVEGRDIKMLKISNSNAENTGIWLDGATHAREWITTSVVTYIADYLARHFETISAHYTNKDWYFVPVVNPDGYNHSHTVDRMWRKNRARFGNAVTGVDLNRNFGYFWGRGGNDHSSGDPNHINYRGTEPFSEPETAAVKDIILYSGTPFKIFLSFHSFSEAIAFPWCHTAEPCPDYVNLLEGGTAMAKAIFETSGRMYKVGNFKDIMYYASGTSIDWSYARARIPFSYLVELRSKQNKFLLPRDEILICCKEILNGVKALVKFADKTSCSNCTVNTKKLRQ